MMRNAWIVAAALAACTGKKTEGGGAPAAAKPCPAGQVDSGGTCVVVVTPDKIAQVAQQQSRIDDLAKLLDQVTVVEAPIDILDGMRQLDQWKMLAATNDKAKLADDMVATLKNAVVTLRTFKANLGEVSSRVGNLKGELDKLMNDPTTARRIEDVRAQISTQIKATVTPFAAQVTDTIQNALVPLSAKLEDVSAMVDIACGTVRLSGGDKAKDLCKNAKDTFATGTKFLDDFKTRPAALYDDVSKTFATQLDQLVDTETKALLDTTQAKVDAALKLPPSGSGTATGSGSGSASK